MRLAILSLSTRSIVVRPASDSPKPAKEQLPSNVNGQRSKMPTFAEAKATSMFWIELQDQSTEPKSSGSSPRSDTNPVIHPAHRVYRRRWFGLVQLILLNLVVSFDVGSMPGSFDLGSWTGLI